MVFAGVDVSTRRVAVMLSDREGLSPVPVLVTLTGTGGDPLSCSQAYHLTRDAVSLCTRGPLFTCIEQPILARGNVQTTIKIARVTGAVMAAMCEFGEVVGVTPSEWKRTVGDARADKARVGELLEKQWPEGRAAASTDRDLVDAAAICLHARRITGPG